MHTDHHQNNHHEEDDAGEASGPLIPFPRTSPEQHHTWITGRDWRVEWIDTEPMTQQHHDAAVTALAALINQWLTERNNNGTTKNGIDESDDTA